MPVPLQIHNTAFLDTRRTTVSTEEPHGIKHSTFPDRLSPNMAPRGSISFLESANNTQDVQNWQAGIDKSAQDDFEGATKNISHTDRPEALLRRLSIADRPHSQGEVPHTGPDILHPSSGVSGRIISVVFCVPFSIRYRKSAEWVWYHELFMVSAY